jgi:hypothetical protein
VLIMVGVSASGTAKPLVDESDRHDHHLPRGLRCFLSCRAAVVVQTLTCTAGIIHRHRTKIGSPWRKLSPGQQALLVLAYLRKGETFADLATGFGIGTATAWRYVTETAAGGPVPEAAPGAGRCAGGRARLCGPRRHVNPHRSPQLKTWRILRKLRCCPWRAGQLAKAIHVVQAREIAR